MSTEAVKPPVVRLVLPIRSENAPGATTLPLRVTQCPAVMTQRALISVPPQLVVLLDTRWTTDTCAGHAWLGA